MSTRAFGENVQRNADPRLLRGEGNFVDDIPLHGCLHVAFVRSEYARARIISLDVSEARAHPDVIAVYTCDDLGDCDQELPLLIPHPCIVGPKTQRPLARDDVFYMGQAIAMIVAIDRYTAEDAALLVNVEYEPLEVEMDMEVAIIDGAPLVHADVVNNIAAHLVQESGDVDKAFSTAKHFTRVRVQVDRSTAAPLEGKILAATWDRTSEELTVWDTTQAPISVRGGLASIFQLSEDSIRVIAPDIGGGFGQKIMMFTPEEILVPLAAMELQRPIKFVEDRVENFIAASQERTQIHEIELAATSEGEILGLKDTFLHDTGAFIPYGIAIAQVASTSIAGPYRIPNVWVEFKAVYTPTVQITPYRGCGRPQACFAIERAMDQLADELKLDRFEVRRRNLIQPDQFPYLRRGLQFADGLAVCYDSGDYPKALDKIRDVIDLPAFQKDRDVARSEHRYLGLGLGFYVEGTGLGPYEGGSIKIHPITGKVYVSTGLSGQGQGHETVLAQIAADQCGARVEDVIVVEGDTGSFGWGVATFASRAAVTSGNAVHKAALKARAQIIEAAANMLETKQTDIDLKNGKAWQKSKDRSVSLAEVATASNPLRYAFNEASKTATQFAPASKHDGPALAEGQHPGIVATDWYSPPHAAWAYGVHAAIVEVDPELCSVAIKRYVVIHDCGKMINPMIVDGQILGGVAQGLGGALFERLEYGKDGVLQNPNFVDFLMPFATEVPNVELFHMETPSPLNPLGVKGVGEAGTIATAQVIASAIEDALGEFDIQPIRHVPVTPSMLHEKLRNSQMG